MKPYVTTTAIKRSLMLKLKMMEEEVGQLVCKGKNKDYTHVVWESKVAKLWGQLGDNNRLLIPEV
jgi:hypothetical protein